MTDPTIQTRMVDIGKKGCRGEIWEAGDGSP